MDVFRTVKAQIAAMRLPLIAVTFTALPRGHTPSLLILHWHGFREARPTASPGPERDLRPVPSSALQINENWRTLAELDRGLLEAAWQLGAWELDREERRACSTIGAPEREALECRQAFGDNPLCPGDEAHLVAEAPDRADMLRLGAAVGYVRWQFRPVHGGVWQQTADDDTLDADGARRLPCPVTPREPVGTRVSRTRYRLGHKNGLILPR